MKRFLFLGFVAITVLAITACPNYSGGGGGTKLTLTTVSTPFGVQVVATTTAKAIRAYAKDIAPQSGVTFALNPATSAATVNSTTGLVTPIANPPTSVTVVATASDGSVASIDVPLIPIDLAGTFAAKNGNASAAMWKLDTLTADGATYTAANPGPYDMSGSGSINLFAIRFLWIANCPDTTLFADQTYPPGSTLSILGFGNKLNAGIYYQANPDGSPLAPGANEWSVVDGAYSAPGGGFTYSSSGTSLIVTAPAATLGQSGFPSLAVMGILTAVDATASSVTGIAWAGFPPRPNK